MSHFAVTLLPNGWDDRVKALKVNEKDWRLAVEVVGRRGYRPNAFAGLDRVSTKLFAEALGQALGQGSVPEPAHDVLRRLLTFLTGPGAGGFGITRGWAW